MDFGTLLSILIGAAVTWAVSWFFYRQATKDLNEQVGRLAGSNRHLANLVNTLTRAMENDGLISVNGIQQRTN